MDSSELFGFKTLRQVLKLAVSQGYAPFNVALGLQRMVEPQDGIPALSEQQIDALLNQCDLTTFTGLRDYAMISLMLDTGIRLREMTTLKIDQVDLRNLKLRDVLGKNRKVEDIAVSGPVCAVLEHYINERNRVKVTTDIAFVTISGTALKRNTVYHLIKDYGKAVGITDVRVSPHTFRHTLAKHWILNGGDPFSLQKTLRQSDMEMVKRYIHMWGHELAQRHEKFSPMAKRKLAASRPIKGRKK